MLHCGRLQSYLQTLQSALKACQKHYSFFGHSSIMSVKSFTRLGLGLIFRCKTVAYLSEVPL